MPRNPIDRIEDFPESAGLGGIVGAATSNRDRSRSRSPIRVRIDTAPRPYDRTDDIWKIQLQPCGDRSEKQEEGTYSESESERENKSAERKLRREQLCLPKAHCSAVDTKSEGEQREYHPKLRATFIPQP